MDMPTITETVRNDDRLMTAEELSGYLGVPKATLYAWRSRPGSGPVAYRVGRYLRYRRSNVDRWLETTGEAA